MHRSNLFPITRRELAVPVFSTVVVGVRQTGNEQTRSMVMADEGQELAQGSVTEVVNVETFDPSEVRPWQYHNRTRSGMDDASLNSLASSIVRDGQQQLGARQAPAGGGHPRGGSDLWRAPPGSVPARRRALACGGARRVFLGCPVRRAHARRERVDRRRFAPGERRTVESHAGCRGIQEPSRRWRRSSVATAARFRGRYARRRLCWANGGSSVWYAR